MSGAPPVLLPAGLVVAGLVVAVRQHVDLAEVDNSGGVGEAIYDRVRRNAVGQFGNPVR